MTLDDVAAALAEERLLVMGAFHPTPDDAAPDTCKTLVMVGPDEPAFWPHVQAAPEFGDGAPDPLNRWSERVIRGFADALGAAPLFPFGGPPYQPFLTWATRTGRVWASPIQLLVHDTAGLWVSFRGALAFDRQIALPETGPSPCESCENQPCIRSCPTDAFAGGTYDVPRCKVHLETPQGDDCMTLGCAARRACPISQGWGRSPEQAAFHMKAFNPR